MTPFQEFRYWSRRAPSSERVAAGIASVVVLALLGWMLVPGGSHSTPLAASGGGSGGQGAIGAGTGGGTAGVTAQSVGGASSASGGVGASQTGAAGGGPVGGTSGASASGGPSGGPGAAGGTASGPAGACPAGGGGVSGISATEIKVAVTLTNIVGPAANSAFGVPTTSQQQADYQEIIDAINHDGGVACRKIAAQFFTANPTDANDLQQKCLDIAGAGVFAEIDSGGYADRPISGCYAQHHVPFFGAYLFAASLANQFYPYLFNFNTFDSLYRNTVFGLRDRGFFSPAKGFKKLGFVYRSCYPQLISEMTGWLKQAGLASSQIVTYDVGCPSALANPSDLEQAVLKFQQNGVSHVTTANFVGDFANFTTVAQQQGFHPSYGLPDDSLIPLNSGSQHPDFNNIANAISITASRDGEDRTPGAAPSAGTARCNAIYQSHGQPPVYQQAAFAGNACDELWMFVAAVQHAPSLDQTSLAAGLQKAGSVDFSFPQGPNNFAGDRVTYGGQSWRVAQFMTKCNCWQVVDPAFHPSFP